MIHLNYGLDRVKPGDYCDDTCTVDCGHCKGAGKEAVTVRRCPTELEAVADLIADRLELAMVQRIQQTVLEMLRDGAEYTQCLPVNTGYDYVLLRLGRRGNMLEIRFEVNGQLAATFRYTGHTA
jgi:hypothetical protein